MKKKGVRNAYCKFPVSYTHLDVYKRQPYGGAVTAASMLPIIIAGYRHGLKWGLITSFTYSILQLLTGLSNVSYATSTTAMIAIILLDYIVAFTVLGLLGVVKKNKHQTGALVLGTLIVCLLRYLCHFITGCTVWAGAVSYTHL